MFSRSSRFATLFALAGALCALLVPAAVRAQVRVTTNVFYTGALFNYSYSVTNATSQDLAILTFSGPTQAGALTNITAPTGFFVSFDPGVGLFSFAEDADPNTPQTFAPGTTVSGFSFSSRFAPTVTQFQALDVNANTFTGNVLTPTGGPSPVPESGTIIPLGFGLLGLTLFTVRRRVIRDRAASRSYRKV